MIDVTGIKIHCKNIRMLLLLRYLAGRFGKSLNDTKTETIRPIEAKVSTILTIFGKTGSTAETFAQAHGFTFVAVS